MQDTEQLILTIQHNVINALMEDIGTGDATAQLIPAQITTTASVISREPAILCGTAWFNSCFLTLAPDTRIDWHARDGESVSSGQTLCKLHGDARVLLSAERTALNFLQMLSATATLTRRYVDAVQDTHCQIMDTRKTLPGLRIAQKYAVRTGGGSNQRNGLYDGILIKENHILAAGSIATALAASHHSTLPIQIEVENLNELEQALSAGASLILLDNFTIPELHAAVSLTAGRAILEASGGVNLSNVRDIALTGVQRISIGDLTKHILAIDLSMRILHKTA